MTFYLSPDLAAWRFNLLLRTAHFLNFSFQLLSGCLLPASFCRLKGVEAARKSGGFQPVGKEVEFAGGEAEGGGAGDG